MFSLRWTVVFCVFLLLAGCGNSTSSEAPSSDESQPAVEIVEDQSRSETPDDNVNPPEPGSLVGESVSTFPDTDLVNQFGESVSIESLPDRPTLIGFIYTRCPMPKMCPLITYKFRQVQQELKEQTSPPVQLVLVTFDPEYDTPAVLREYAQKRDIDFSNFELWTGPPETIDRLTGRFKIFTRKTHTQEGSTVYNHNLRIYLLDSRRVVRFWYRGSDWKVENVVSHLRSLAEATQT